jgi:Tfp pilus assembly protein PilN
MNLNLQKIILVRRLIVWLEVKRRARVLSLKIAWITSASRVSPWMEMIRRVNIMQDYNTDALIAAAPQDEAEAKSAVEVVANERKLDTLALDHAMKKGWPKILTSSLAS